VRGPRRACRGFAGLAGAEAGRLGPGPNAGGCRIKSDTPIRLFLHSVSAVNRVSTIQIQKVFRTLQGEKPGRSRRRFGIQSGGARGGPVPGLAGFTFPDVPALPRQFHSEGCHERRCTRSRLGERSQAIAVALAALKKGDNTVRLPLDWTGLPGKLSETFNEVVELNEAWRWNWRACASPSARKES